MFTLCKLCSIQQQQKNTIDEMEQILPVWIAQIK